MYADCLRPLVTDTIQYGCGSHLSLAVRKGFHAVLSDLRKPPSVSNTLRFLCMFVRTVIMEKRANNSALHVANGTASISSMVMPIFITRLAS